MGNHETLKQLKCILNTKAWPHPEAVALRIAIKLFQHRVDSLDKGDACGQCGIKEPPFFIVRDELWLSVADRKEFLCIDCFEARLGRKVVFTDLKPCGITNHMLLGCRIQKNSNEPS